MSERSEPRWLNVEAAAAYISVRVDAIPRLVRQGRIPKPDYTLGQRSPRWDRLALDAAFDGGPASADARHAFQGLANEIAAKGAPSTARRSTHTR
ncbi:MAG TPA: hypothetical protein VH024_17595 [Candidatus Angelobacter sp.]|jgi:hypothetical protein|nr:hypothetical protein [Candidatus Angelobacter sp.]